MGTRRSIILSPIRFTNTTPPASGGSYAPIGDQNSFNESSTTWDGLDAAPLIGTEYAPFDVIDSTGNIEWGTVNGSFQTGRMHAWGPWELVENAESIISVVVPVRCGASAGTFRFGIYSDNGSMLDSTTDVSTAGAYPANLIAMSAEQSLSANAAPALREITLNTGAVNAGFYWGAFWRSSVANGADPIIVPNGAIMRQWRTPSGNPSYSSGGAAPSTFPAGATGANRYSGLWYAKYRPVAPTAPSSVAISVDNDRSTYITWANTDSRTTRVRIERRKNAGAWVYAAIVEGTDYKDVDLEAGATYEYRLYACYKNAQSPASAIVSAIATGVRTATITVTPTKVSTMNSDTLRGIYGLTHDLEANNPPVYQHTGYKRTGGTEWGDIQSTSNPNVYDWSAYTSYLNGLSSKERGILRTRHAVSEGGNTLPPFVTANGAYYSIDTDGTYFANLGNAQVWTWAQGWINSFGSNFNNDNRVVMMKVGVHNRYGEWSGSMPAEAQLSVSRQIDIIDAMLAAFPNKYFSMSCTPEHDVMWYAAQQDRIIAFEQLSLGDEDGPNQWRRFWGDTPPRVRKKIYERMMGKWTEHKATDNDTNTNKWISGVYDMQQLGLTLLSDRNMSTSINMTNNNTRMLTQLSLAGYRFDLNKAVLPSAIIRSQPFKVVLFWQNAGNGIYPPIEVRNPHIELRKNGTLVWGNSTGYNLATLHPHSEATAVASTLTVTGIAADTYDLCLRVPGDSRTNDMRLGINGRTNDSYYILANNIVVS